MRKRSLGPGFFVRETRLRREFRLERVEINEQSFFIWTIEFRLDNVRSSLDIKVKSCDGVLVFCRVVTNGTCVAAVASSTEQRAAAKAERIRIGLSGSLTLSLALSAECKRIVSRNLPELWAFLSCTASHRVWARLSKLRGSLFLGVCEWRIHSRGVGRR